MKKRRLKQKLILPLKITGVILSGIILILILDIFVFNNVRFFGLKSVNAGAASYKTKSCLAFYPKTKDGKEIAKSLCDNAMEEDAVFDYALIPYGDYYLVEYGNNIHYYIDHDNKPLSITSISEDGVKILSEYLRYNMKKEEIDEAYTLDFINETSVENLDISNCTYKVEGEYLEVSFPKYNFISKVPLKYIQKEAGINLGYTNEKYVKPKYVSPKRKTVAFTFDDGPRIGSSDKIIDTFYKHDGVATFFVLGWRLEPKTIGIISDSIEKGNEYGSHSQSHPYLRSLSAKEEYDEVMSVVSDVRDGCHEGKGYDFEGTDYEMKIYRAPYGEHKSSSDTSLDIMSIEWDCDSEDWKSRDPKIIKSEIYDFDEKNKGGLDGCIVLFHDIYDETASAISDLVPELIDKGYQFITVSEMLDLLKVDKTKTYYPW